MWGKVHICQGWGKMTTTTTMGRRGEKTIILTNKRMVEKIITNQSMQKKERITEIILSPIRSFPSCWAAPPSTTREIYIAWKSQFILQSQGHIGLTASYTNNQHHKCNILFLRKHSFASNRDEFHRWILSLAILELVFSKMLCSKG